MRISCCYFDKFVNTITNKKHSLTMVGCILQNKLIIINKIKVSVQKND